MHVVKLPLLRLGHNEWSNVVTVVLVERHVASIAVGELQIMETVSGMHGEHGMLLSSVGCMRRMVLPCEQGEQFKSHE